jgi:Mitochondrial inner-membrane-bound regulator
MRIWLARDASVCLRCQIRINRSLLPPRSYESHPYRSSARAQSTAAAVAEDIGEEVAEPQETQRSSKKAKKQLRRVWKPPRVAELGVSSLGKPAEVLVLKDRNRHVPTAANDQAERAKASELQILETLQAENLPLSSASVRQSIDHIGEPFLKQSKELSGAERAELKKKLLDGFTQNQLRSYCEGRNRIKPLKHTVVRPIEDKVSTATVRSPATAKNARETPDAARLRPHIGKAGLVEHILRHKWALASNEDEQAMQQIPLTQQKLDYILKCQPSLLERYQDQYDVAIDASQDGAIKISGKLSQVRGAKSAIELFLEGVTSSPVRSMTVGRTLGNIATSSFLENLMQIYGVVIAWTPRKDRKTRKNEDRLMLYYHKTLDAENALNAKRAILRAERGRIPDHRRHQLSMWCSKIDAKPDHVLHQVSERLMENNSNRAWARRVVPHQPIQMEHGELEVERTSHKIQQHLKSLRKESGSLTKLLTGGYDDFFTLLPSKREPAFKFLFNKGLIKEEISVDFGKVLSPIGDGTAGTFYDVKTSPNGRLSKSKVSSLTLLSPEIPALPNFLKSLTPFEEASDEGTKHIRRYRLRYVPVTSEWPFNSEAPIIEIDVLRKENPGSCITNSVATAWAILDQQTHKLLTPAFAVDLLFVRRLKQQLSKSGTTERAWLRKFEKKIETLGSGSFPPFVKALIPEYTVKDDRTKGGNIADEFGSKLDPKATSLHCGHHPAISALSLGPVIIPPWVVIKEGTSRTNMSAKTVDYMLETCQLVHSKAYRWKTLCLEHLYIEGTDPGENQVSLRLARQPLLENNIEETAILVLAQRAYKIAALLSDPHLVDRSELTAPLEL